MERVKIQCSLHSGALLELCKNPPIFLTFLTIYTFDIIIVREGGVQITCLSSLREAGMSKILLGTSPPLPLIEIGLTYLTLFIVSDLLLFLTRVKIRLGYYGVMTSKPL